MHTQCASYHPGNTDLAWTRITPWRALLAAALDQHPLKVTGAPSPPSGSAPAPTCSSPGSATGSRCAVDAQELRGPRHHRGRARDQGGPDQRSRARTASWRRSPRPDRPGPAGRAQAPRAARAARRGAAPARRGRRLRRDRHASWSKLRTHERHDRTPHRGPPGRRRRSPPPSPASCSAGSPTRRRPGDGPADRADRRHHRRGDPPRDRPARRPDSGVDWSQVVVWWGDERFVAPDSPDRNARQAQAAFLDAVGVDPAKVHADAVDRRRGRRRRRRGGVRRRRCGSTAPAVRHLMLGVGPDGHIASLFPGFPQLDSRRDRGRRHRLARSRRPSGSPSPSRPSTGPGRCGSSSAAPTRPPPSRSALGGADLHEIPAAGVTGREETIWFLDREAASRSCDGRVGANEFVTAESGTVRQLQCAESS